MTRDALQQRVQDYLRAHHVMTLATAGDDGPWGAAVFYAHEGWALHFLSARESRHCRNLARSPQVSVTIQEDYSAWREIRGVQLEGIVAPLSGGEATRARDLYAAKFPLLNTAPASIARALAKVTWYRVAPVRVYFIDNSVAFGHRDEISVASG